MHSLRALWIVVLLPGLHIGTQSRDDASEIPPHGAAISLFSAKNSFDTFIEGKGLNSDPDGVFRFENGVLHVSGTEMGYIITRRSFDQFYLRVEFKWGEGTFGVRKGKARDSGILYNIQGENKVWPQSIEFQITEGGTGDFWMTDGAALTASDGHRVEGPPRKALKIDHVGKGVVKDIVGYRDPVGDLERPHGEWNVLELVVQGDRVKQYVNGKLANEGSNPSPRSGKILLQSEGAEVFFRNMMISPLL